MAHMICFHGDPKYNQVLQNLRQTIGMGRAIKDLDEDCYQRGESFIDDVVEKASEVLRAVMAHCGATDRQLTSAASWRDGMANWFERSGAADTDPEVYLEEDELD
jgi:hypothetical protein